MRVGKISNAQLELCQAAADKTGRRTGDVLVEMGLLKETEKLYYVAQQVKAIIYSVFGWEEGEYRLHFADRAGKEAIKIDLHPANLITRGVKKLYKPERLFRLLSPEDRLIPSPQPAYGLHEVELERWEAEILPKVDGTRTLAELIHLAQRPEHAVYGFLYGLVALKNPGSNRALAGAPPSARSVQAGRPVPPCSEDRAHPAITAIPGTPAGRSCLSGSAC